MNTLCTFWLQVQWEKKINPPRIPLTTVKTKNKARLCSKCAKDPDMNEMRQRKRRKISEPCMYFADLCCISSSSGKFNKKCETLWWLQNDDYLPSNGIMTLSSTDPAASISMMVITVNMVKGMNSANAREELISIQQLFHKKSWGNLIIFSI